MAGYGFSVPGSWSSWLKTQSKNSHLNPVDTNSSAVNTKSLLKSNYYGCKFHGKYGISTIYLILKTMKRLLVPSIFMALTLSVFAQTPQKMSYQCVVRDNIGNNNTAIGEDTLSNNSTGSANTAIGYYSLTTNTTGNENTAVGLFANVASENLTNATVLGCNATVNASNKVRIGKSSVTVIEGQVNWSVGSDKRLKDNIEYSDRLGLEFINSLKTATFTYKNDSANRHHDGLIAQDVRETLNKLGLDFSGLIESENDDKILNISYAEFVIPLINAVQELSSKNQEQQKQIEELKALVSTLIANQTVSGKK